METQISTPLPIDKIDECLNDKDKKYLLILRAHGYEDFEVFEVKKETEEGTIRMPILLTRLSRNNNHL